MDNIDIDKLLENVVPMEDLKELQVGHIIKGVIAARPWNDTIGRAVGWCLSFNLHNYKSLNNNDIKQINEKNLLELNYSIKNGAEKHARFLIRTGGFHPCFFCEPREGMEPPSRWSGSGSCEGPLDWGTNAVSDEGSGWSVSEMA